MNLTAWVDVAIGLTLVYLGASLFVTVLNEYVAQILNLRGTKLCASLATLISDKTVKAILKQSPALSPFFDATTKQRRIPSYVDPNMLARLLVGGLADPSVVGSTAQQVAASVEKLEDSDFKSQLQALMRSAGSTADELVKEVSDWVDSSLTVLGERYKRNLHSISLGIGLLVAVGFNLDTVTLTAHLYRDREAREAAVALGIQIAEKTGAFEACMSLAPGERKKSATCAPLTGLVDAVQSRNKSLGQLPIGWPLADISTQGTDSKFGDFWLWLSRIVGWLLTAMALALGAPFWFDLLNKLVNVRYGMRRPEVKGERK